MTKKRILQAVALLLLEALLSLVEKKFFLHGLALSLSLALLYCKAHPLVSLLPYVLSNGLVHFDLTYLAVVSTGLVFASVLVLLRRRFKLKSGIWENAVVITVTQIPVILLYCTSVSDYIRVGVGTLLSITFCYVSVAVAYPIVRRGLRYGLTGKEKVFFALFFLPIATGIALLDVYGVRFIYFAIALFAVFLTSLGEGGLALGVAISMGVGGSLAGGTLFEAAAACFIVGGAAVFTAVWRYFGGVGALGGYALCLYLFGGVFSWQTLVPVGVAALVGFLPEKLYVYLRSFRESGKGKFALRTVANRDREEVSAKLRSVAGAFRKARAVLSVEQGGEVTPAEVADGIAEACCRECLKFASCREKIGDARKYFVKLAVKGAENGRVNFLDVDGTLGATCTRLPKVLNVAGEYVRAQKIASEKKSGIEQGRDMVMSSLGGTATLLDELAASVGQGFSFDVEKERKITDELAYVNVVAGDAAIYGNGERISLTVREGDEKKKELSQVIGETIGRKVYAAERKVGVNGTVNLVFRKIPEFGALYGEKTVSAEKDCGDSKEAVKISSDKLMFILSDGMGTGKEAKTAGLNAVGLIETFYKAGFSHSTVFSCVGKLLALRQKETFSALDVAILDTQTGEIDFIKQGGRESYFITKNGVEKIDGGSLPLGILEESVPIVVTKSARGNELVVMMSDGVADVLSDSDVTEIVGALNTLNPQTIADKLMENAVKKATRKDDMTVMVFRVVKN